MIGGRPTGELLGIGAKTEHKLAELGIATVAELADGRPRRGGGQARADDRAVAGADRPRPGLGRRCSAEPYVPRSRSRETTFQQNIEDWAQVREEVLRLAAQVTRDVEAEQRPAVRIVVKVRHAPFFTSTHGQTLAEPTSDGP